MGGATCSLKPREMRGPIETALRAVVTASSRVVSSRAKCAALLKPSSAHSDASSNHLSLKPREMRGPIETRAGTRTPACRVGVSSRAKCAALLKLVVHVYRHLLLLCVSSRAKCAALLKPIITVESVTANLSRLKPREMRGPIETESCGGSSRGAW